MFVNVVDDGVKGKGVVGSYIEYDMTFRYELWVRMMYL